MLGWKRFSFVLTLSLSDGYGDNKFSFAFGTFKQEYFPARLSGEFVFTSELSYLSSEEFEEWKLILQLGILGNTNVMPEIDDDKGVSAVMVSTEKGKKSGEKLQLLTMRLLLMMW